MKINVWSDYACPFCWIGEVRLRKALEELGLQEHAEMIPRAFELNPNAPRESSVNGLGTIAGRYGMSLAQARAEFAKIAEMGRADGLTLKQEETRHTRTFDAHRLMKLGLAQNDRDLAGRLNELLFAAFFVDNLNLAHEDVLLEIGRKAGLEEKMIRDMLESDAYAAEVLADEAEAAKKGIHAVPYFVLENGAAISGAMPVEEFRKALKGAAAASADLQCGANGCRLE